VPHGAVAADNPIASQMGAEALRKGGNAVDAACATALALGVASPASSGIGGGGFMVVYLAKTNKVLALDFRERAPTAATRDMFVRGGKAHPELAETGPLASGVPGEVAGLAEAVGKYGKLGWKACVEPAARLAHEPVAVSNYVAHRIERGERKGFTKELAAIFVPDGKPLIEGGLFRRPDFARTLDELALDSSSFYKGDLGKALVASMRARGGILSEKDLADYRPMWREPIESSYRGHRVVTMPPPSSGGVALIETLNILSRHEVGKLGWGSSAYFHLVAEALKHAFADRARYLGDTDFVKVPLKHLVARDYAGELDRRIDPDKVRPVADYGTPTQTGSRLRDAGTSHLSVIDADGNAVALTTTINGGFGSRVIAGSTGILMNNQMDDFASQPGVPNEDGLITGEENAIAPGKRPLSSMTPTIVFDGDKPWFAVGGAGSGRIITGTLQTLLGVVDFGLDAQAAVSSPRIHTQWMPDVLGYEEFIPLDVTQALARRGHKVKLEKESCVIQMVARGADGRVSAASDPRKQGAPAGH
jgi:gamma-glutamyltranspeptidase/glutathione hydrolase